MKFITALFIFLILFLISYGIGALFGFDWRWAFVVYSFLSIWAHIGDD